MAKITGGLLSITASGTIGKMLTYSISKGVQYVKGNRLEKSGAYHFIKKKYFSETEDQLGVREYFKNAINEWNKLNDEEKQEYYKKAKSEKNTAVGIFVKKEMKLYYDKSNYKKVYLFGIGANCILPAFNNDFMITAMLAKGKS